MNAVVSKISAVTEQSSRYLNNDNLTGVFLCVAAHFGIESVGSLLIDLTDAAGLGIVNGLQQHNGFGVVFVDDIHDFAEISVKACGNGIELRIILFNQRIRHKPHQVAHQKVVAADGNADDIRFFDICKNGFVSKTADKILRGMAGHGMIRIGVAVGVGNDFAVAGLNGIGDARAVGNRVTEHNIMQRIFFGRCRHGKAAEQHKHTQ